MSNPNPFVPKGSLLEQQTQRRSRLKLAVFCIVAVGVTGLVAMLIQGCKRDTSTDLNPLPDVSTNSSVTDTNLNPPLTTDTNTAPPIYVPPTITNTPPTPPQPQVTPTVETGGTEYVVVAGDTLGKIAKKNGVSLKALEAANPGVDSKHLKVKQKLTIPAGGSSATATPAAATADATAADTGSETTYIVKSGDTLHKIAKKFHVSVKAIEVANANVDPNHIKVGRKLKIPAKAETSAPVQTTPAPAPVPDTTPAPVAQPISSTPPTLTPAPATPAPTK
jgi:LysM repeat protein